MKKLTPDQAQKFHAFFADWFNHQNIYTLPTFSKEINIPYKSVFDYYKERSTPSLERANGIIDFIKNKKKDAPAGNNNSFNSGVVKTDIDLKKEIIERYTTQLKSILDSFESEIKLGNEKSTSKEDLPIHLDNVNNSFYKLYIELEWFKSRSSKERDAFRKSISPNDVGYITTLIRAMAKGEDTLNDWIMNSNYNLEMLKWQKRH
jgi:hypothetical protein